MKNVSTLSALQNSASGNTTRQVDFAIQSLFNGDKVFCSDHRDSGGNKKENDLLLTKVLSRLEAEHKITTKFGKGKTGSTKAVVDKKSGSIHLESK